MTAIESKNSINQPIEIVFKFLADFNNHERLMPPNISDWKSTADEASFSIQQMAKLALKMQSRTAHDTIIMVPAEKPPFDLTLSWKLRAITPITTEATFTITADLNMMMKMVAAGPLKKLTDFQTTKLQEELER